MTSNASSKGRAFWGLYASTKAALESLVLSYAQEVEETPLRVNLVNPGRIRTKMRAEAYPGEDPKPFRQLKASPMCLSIWPQPIAQNMPRSSTHTKPK